MYGAPAAGELLDWEWVEAELTGSGTYWVSPGGVDVPHPRPVWGIWSADALHLSVGSPLIRQQLQPGRAVTVHLPSGTDVVIVEGVVEGSTSAVEFIRPYDRKYDWTYDIDQYGPLTSIAATTVTAWRASGPAGRDGFVASGSWRFDRSAESE